MLLCSICPDYVVNTMRKPQCLTAKQAWYTFYRYRWDESLSAPFPSPDSNSGPVGWLRGSLISKLFGLNNLMLNEIFIL